MLAILSPAKTLDFSKNKYLDHTIPEFMPESQELINELKMNSVEDLSTLMKLSTSLSTLNVERYNNWNNNFDLSNSKQSILCFKGGVYVGLDVESFSGEELLYSQDYLRILSGLHGILKPLDLIQPYRLEMGTKLKTKKGKNLYEFWGDKITSSLNNTLLSSNSSVLVNLASNEYFSSLNYDKINADILDIKFLDKKNGSYKIVSFFAKKARGSMASFILKNRVKDINYLKEFKGLGYSFDQSRSEKKSLVFTR
ncbi:MAG: hypothetical protein CMD26_03095 [Flavobacteriales bacterium]|nr:hypothetical protein [Flavobacteriales bacterium]|tara:strand:- start:17271 stop:18032 length:762 start_codon:yes stop_codon:yes gene_type:complete